MPSVDPGGSQMGGSDCRNQQPESGQNVYQNSLTLSQLIPINDYSPDCNPYVQVFSNWNNSQDSATQIQYGHNNMSQSQCLHDSQHDIPASQDFIPGQDYIAMLDKELLNLPKDTYLNNWSN